MWGMPCLYIRSYMHSGDEEDRNFGKFIVIHPRHFYFLAHIRRGSHAPVGETVYPGMTVAHVSNTGGVFTNRRPVTDAQRRDGLGAHLHLHLLIADEAGDTSEIDYFLWDSTGNPIHGNLNGRSFNPFLHSERWRGS